MRNVFADAVGKLSATNFGHGYDVLAPKPGPGGKPDVKERDAWLNHCADITIDTDYHLHYARWKQSFAAAETMELKAQTRLLIGHGNPSGADVGLTVHRTWGVPVLPGSALKGLLAHYVDAVYGGGDDGSGPKRSDWCAATWDGPRVIKKAGTHFAASEVRLRCTLRL